MSPEAPQSAGPVENVRALMTSSHAAVRAGLVINGGGALAVVALIGHLASQSYARLPLDQFGLPFYLFVLGVFSGAVTFGVQYVAQRFYLDGRLRPAHLFNAATVALIFSEYALFLLGAHFLYRVFTHGVAA